jgi:hypothetical protein
MFDIMNNIFLQEDILDCFKNHVDIRDYDKLKRVSSKYKKYFDLKPLIDDKKYEDIMIINGCSIDILAIIMTKNIIKKYDYEENNYIMEQILKHKDSFSLLPTNITLCSGKFGQLSGSSIGGSGLYNYLWSPILNLGSPTSNTTSVTGTSTTVYTLSVTDANCSMTLPISTTSTVNINPLPVITMTTSNNRGCEIFCTDLISSSSPPSVSCQWHFSNNTFFNSCDTTSYCFPTPGTYGSTLTVTDVNGCVDSTKSSSFIIVDPNPDADFTWLPENPTVLINEVSFTDKSTIGSQISGWHWDFGDTSATNDTSNISKYSYIYGSPNSNSYFITLKVLFSHLVG